VGEGGADRFECRVGHSFSLESLLAAESEYLEAALWTALRTLEERAALYRRMAERHRMSGNTRTAERFSLRAESAVQHAFVLREVVEQFASDSVDEEGAA
jgi:two-component system chemotaxis response regulator CheB